MFYSFVGITEQNWPFYPELALNYVNTVYGGESCAAVYSGAPAAKRAAKRSPIVITGKKRKPMKDFLMVIMASGIARGRVRTTTTTTTTTESRNMAAILQKIG